MKTVTLKSLKDKKKFQVVASRPSRQQSMIVWETQTKVKGGGRICTAVKSGRTKTFYGTVYVIPLVKKKRKSWEQLEREHNSRTES